MASSLSTEIKSRRYSISLEWDGNRVTSPAFPFVGLDTEFHPDTKELACICLSNARQCWVIRPESFPEFLERHPEAIWVMHACRVDWPIIYKTLPPRWEWMWKVAVDEGRVRDTMLLDMLLRLARGHVGGGDDDHTGATVPPRKLSVLAAEVLGEKKDDDDPYRMRFGELIGADWTKVDPGFFLYAGRDPLVTLLVYLEQCQQAREIMDRFRPVGRCRDVRPDAFDRWGHLSEVIQVQGALALQDVEVRGIGLDAERVKRTTAELRASMEQTEAYFVERHPDIVPKRHGPKTKKYTPGSLKRGESGALSLTGLQAKLTKVADAIGLLPGEVPMATGVTGGVSKSTKEWDKYRHRDDFLDRWCGYQSAVKLSGFLATVADADRVHPRYNVLASTGRTSCFGPNLQQMPKGEFRKNFVPAKGYKFFVGDLAGAELCTFAAFARWAYGFSVMGDQLEAGRNVHGYFASKILGESYEDFMARKKTDPETFGKLRQIAKPANFGLMGGMGAKAFQTYCANPPYNVKLSEAEVRKLIDQWEEAFPEGKKHRSDYPDLKCIARNIGCTLPALVNVMNSQPDWFTYIRENVVAGKLTNAKGDDYSPWAVQQILDDLADLTTDPELKAALINRELSPALASKVFRRDVALLSGRVVGDVAYTDLRNYVFQGPASDVKVALWRLVRNGFRLVGFVHDELIVEVQTEEEGKEVARIIETSMEEVCGKGVKFTVEWHLTDCWVKP